MAIYMTTLERVMTRVSVVKAKANFSRLLAEVQAGREVLITRRGTAVARISGVPPTKTAPNLKPIAAFRARLAKAVPYGAELVRRVRDERY
jgi:prevent-host-death family protein